MDREHQGTEAGNRRQWGAIASLLLFSATVVRAVSPNLVDIAPAGGQRGKSVDVTFKGERLADTQEILPYGPGITVERLGAKSDKQVKAVLAIAPDCPLGEHTLRLRTASGVSALRIFYVGPFPSVAEVEPNNTPAMAQPIALNSTVEGTLGNEDVDWFTVEAARGQRLSLEIEGARLGRTMLDPFLAVYTAKGQPVAGSENTALLGHDGFVSIIVPMDGKYFIQVRDITYSGSGHYYRLHVGTFPRPAVVYPLGGRPGETLAARFLGDPMGEFDQSITLPDAVVERFGALADHRGIPPSPNWLRVTDVPNVENVPAGTTQANAPLIEQGAPFAYNGVLTYPTEGAFFRFKARKDQNLEIQVYARRLGSPIDSVLTLLNAKGAQLATNDDASGNPDSMFRFRIPADGEYTVKLADQLNRSGPLYVYRVEITDVAPSVIVSIPDTARYDYETRKSIVVPRGNRFAVLLNLNRDTFNGDLKLAFDGLPAGITPLADTVPGSVSAVPVVFEADAAASIAGCLLSPVARPVDPTKTVASRFRHTVEWIRIENDTVYTRSEVNQIAAAVVDEVPFKVHIVEPKVPLVQNGEMDLQIEAERQQGFDAPITVKMLWNPPGVSSVPDMVIPKGASSITYRLNGDGKAEPRKWKIAVVAGAPLQGGTAYVSSQLAELEVAPAFLIGKIDLTKVERGKSARVVCALEHKVAFEGKAVARLLGMPDSVTAKEIEIDPDSKTAAFEVITTDKSPPGLYKNLYCNVVIVQHGEPITQKIAVGGVLRVDAPRAKPPATPPLALLPAPAPGSKIK